MAPKEPRTVIETASVEDLTCYDFGCECGFASIGWPTKKLASARKAQHLEEHRSGEPAPPKAELLSEPAEAVAASVIAAALKRAREGRR